MTSPAHSPQAYTRYTTREPRDYGPGSFRLLTFSVFRCSRRLPVVTGGGSQGDLQVFGQFTKDVVVRDPAAPGAEPASEGSTGEVCAAAPSAVTLSPLPSARLLGRALTPLALSAAPGRFGRRDRRRRREQAARAAAAPRQPELPASVRRAHRLRRRPRECAKPPCHTRTASSRFSTACSRRSYTGIHRLCFRDYFALSLAPHCACT